jgi:multidrug efflux pump subunit AcrB
MAEPLTRTLGRFQNAQEIENLSFEASGSSTTTQSQTSPTPNSQLSTSQSPRRVYLRDFAQVIDGTADSGYLFSSMENQRLKSVCKSSRMLTRLKW